MSRIGKKPIDIPAGVKVEKKAQHLKITGTLGNLEMDCHPHIKVNIDDSGTKVTVENTYPNNRQDKQLHGTMRALIANMILGVNKGFEKKMQIFGTGYNIKEQAGKLVFQIGFCHTVEMPMPKGIKINIEVPATRGNDIPARFTLTSMNKWLLGQFAADIRKIKPPEPYKGKGIRYADEHVRRKVGKAFATGSA